MTWQKKHDIILGWIDSCTTFAQLENMIQFVKKQDFDTDSLFFYLEMKGKQIHAGHLVYCLHELAKLAKKL